MKQNRSDEEKCSLNKNIIQRDKKSMNLSANYINANPPKTKGKSIIL